METGCVSAPGLACSVCGRRVEAELVVSGAELTGWSSEGSNASGKRAQLLPFKAPRQALVPPLDFLQEPGLLGPSSLSSPDDLRMHFSP